MKILGDVISAPFKLLGLTPKAPELPAPVPTVTRDDARAAIQGEDALRRRRGGAADMMTGAGGAEGGGGGKDKLGA